jgi:predicted dehydrogenase
MTQDNTQTTRRGFLRKSTFAVSAFTVLPKSVLGMDGTASPNDKLNIAGIGIGGMGGHNVNECSGENIVALCDVDEAYAEKMFVRYEKAAKYKDYRVMLEKHPEIDAVIIGTPDHTHAVIAMAAMQSGKHVYVQKPLAHSIAEVRRLMDAANSYKGKVQLGNQGHSYNDIRKICEWIWAGAIGPVYEIRAWVGSTYGNGQPRPNESPAIPATLDWDLWLGPAPHRPYHPSYLPGSWRSWLDFGTGVTGDWICHVLDPAFWALDLGAPSMITATSEDETWSPERCPRMVSIEYEFPARGTQPAVKVIWQSKRDIQILIPERYGFTADVPDIGALIIGEKGAILHGSHGGGGARLLPRAVADEFNQVKEILPRLNKSHEMDWLDACKNDFQPGSNLNYGGPLTEIGLLGVIATNLIGHRLHWDCTAMRFTNNEQANAYIDPPYRAGWTL